MTNAFHSSCCRIFVNGVRGIYVLSCPIFVFPMCFSYYTVVCVGQSMVRCRNLYSQYGGKLLLGLSLCMFLFLTFVFLIHTHRCMGWQLQKSWRITEISSNRNSSDKYEPTIHVCIQHEIVCVLCMYLSYT